MLIFFTILILIGFIIFFVLFIAFIIIYSLSDEDRDFADDIKLLLSGLFSLVLILAGFFSIMLGLIKLNVPDKISANILFFGLLLFSLVFYLFISKRQKHQLNMRHDPRARLPLNPMTDIKVILAKTRPHENLISIKKGKLILSLEGGKILRSMNKFSGNRSLLPSELGSFLVIAETNKAYYFDRRKSVLRYSLIDLMLTFILVFINKDLAFISFSVFLFTIGYLMLTPYSFIKHIDKSWLKSESKIENTLDLEGEFPRGSDSAVDAIPHPISKLQFHYKYRYL